MNIETLREEIFAKYYAFSSAEGLTLPDEASAARFSTIAEGLPQVFAQKNPESYLKDLLRYLFAKSMECQVSFTLYADGDRPLAYNTFLGPDEIFEKHYRTNLPLHIEKALDEYVQDAAVFLEEVYEIAKDTAGENELLTAALLAVLQAGYSYAAEKKLAEKRFLNYSNKDMLTPNEIRNAGLNTLMSEMRTNGYRISHFNPTAASQFHIAASFQGNDMFILADVQVHPEKPYFTPRELQALFDLSREREAFPFFTMISVGAANTKHFNSGVLLTSDQIKVRIEHFDQLTIQDS